MKGLINVEVTEEVTEYLINELHEMMEQQVKEQLELRYKNEYLKRDKVAKVFNVSESTIDNWVKKGLEADIDEGNVIRFKQSTVEEWLESRK